VERLLVSELTLAGIVLTTPLLMLVVLLVVAAVAVAIRYQRCPHCRRLAPRAKEQWLRCPRCGRQYHRGLRALR
jgi:tRNA(Ile2) C34 agmatinyltransferase TiaS